ncbi:hypothetical protein [Geomesophilobacter sediminis]|uniref:Uncharacterized protein n=1 Tax=Geomesophilobacter sediminis TaxID=2798584 RepID=A0A8J7M389_9BACT|nr:hypothetical protein [Geomesophilobacter sediminis]MBJ6727591.1 hypothetical protein [Geomesophilobacter sediminis]
MIDLLDLRFYDLNNDNLVLRGGNIADLLIEHPFFRNYQWSTDVAPDPQELKGLVTTLWEKVRAANTGHRNWITERNQAREDLITGLTLIGTYIQMVAVRKKDLSILENTGFRLKSRAATRVVVAQPEYPPVIKSIKRGGKPGSAVIRVKAHPGKVSYVLSMCKGDPVDESSYNVVVQFVTSTKELQDLELATKLTFRLQYDVDGNRSDWSAPVSYIVT